MPELTPEEKQKIYEEEKARVEARGKIKAEKRSHSAFFITLVVILVVVFGGFVRVYYGEPLGFKIMLKDGFSFNDTFVDLTEITGQPRIVVASQHPQVKRQLEQMNIIDTDEEATTKAYNEVMEKARKEYLDKIVQQYQ